MSHSGTGDDMVIIGAIERSFGVQGAMCVRPLTDVPNRFQANVSVWLAGVDGKRVPARVTGVKPHRDRLIVSVDNVSSPEAVAPFRGGYVYALRGAQAAPPDHYYQYELLGLTVVDEQGGRLGVVDTVMEGSAHSVFVVKDGDRELLIPAVREWVRQVDVAAGRMTVRVPEADEVSDQGQSGVRHAL